MKDPYDEYWVQYGTSPTKESGWFKQFVCWHKLNKDAPRRIWHCYPDIDHSQCARCGKWLVTPGNESRLRSLLKAILGGKYDT